VTDQCEFHIQKLQTAWRETFLSIISTLCACHDVCPWPRS